MKFSQLFVASLLCSALSIPAFAQTSGTTTSTGTTGTSTDSVNGGATTTPTNTTGDYNKADSKTGKRHTNTTTPTEGTGSESTPSH